MNRRPPSPVSPLSPFAAAAVPELNTAIAHLRDVLGDQTYESLARKGETMTTAAMVTYAYDQIDQARAELKASRNRPHIRHAPTGLPGNSDLPGRASQKFVSEDVVAYCDTALITK